ncbi:MAG TPA: HutD family protein [Kiloniellaceae bacterium]|nr:HutD family protein [Kiloniellaceae bacterium]
MPNPSTRRVLTSDIAATPWKNGGGVTRELATGGGSGSDWGWRVSLAEVAQDGPFSAFPGVDRVIAVIEGAGMDLVRPDGSTISLEPFRPVRFAGEEPLSGRLRAGPVRDLNVMVRRGVFGAAMEFLRGPCRVERTIGDGDALLLLGLAGRPSVGVNAAPPLELATGEMLLYDAQGRFEFQLVDGSRIALIRIEAR